MMMRSAILLVLLSLLGGVAHADDSSDLRRQVEARVRTKLPADLAVVAVTLSPSLTRLTKSQRRVQSVAVSWLGAPRAGRVSIAVTAVGSDGDKVRGWAQLSLQQIRPVVVALRDLTANSEIESGDLGVRSLPVARGRGWQLRPDTLNGVKVLRNVARGQVIGAEDVEEPAPVLRGTQVSVLVRRGAVTISARGRLEHSARPGSPTSARLVGVGKMVRGLLVDPTTLVVENQR